jgi:hypothetical protein
VPNDAFHFHFEEAVRKASCRYEAHTDHVPHKTREITFEVGCSEDRLEAPAIPPEFRDTLVSSASGSEKKLLTVPETGKTADAPETARGRPALRAAA